jgi:DNA-binding HxlR family transcriptional regulator
MSGQGVSVVERSRGWSGQPSQPQIFKDGIEFEECPISVSLGVLGKRWTLLVLRDIGFRKIDRFNRLLESVSGITPRILARRLKELEREEFIERVEEVRVPKVVRWALTAKGKDTLPVLVQLVVFGAKWYSSEVFKDSKPRTPDDLFELRALALIRPLHKG